MYRSLVIASFLGFIPLSAGAQERVHILSDSLGWVLSYHTVRGVPAVCQVSTRAQPGPRLTYFYAGEFAHWPQFRYPLEGDPTELHLTSFTFWRDSAGPVQRSASAYETRTNALLLHRDELARLARGAKRLLVRATYRERGSYQDLTFDLQGLNALAPDLEPRCPVRKAPPEFLTGSLQSPYRQIFARQVLAQ